MYIAPLLEMRTRLAVFSSTPTMRLVQNATF